MLSNITPPKRSQVVQREIALSLFPEFRTQINRPESVWLARLATLKPCRAVFHLLAPLTVRRVRTRTSNAALYEDISVAVPVLSAPEPLHWIARIVQDVGTVICNRWCVILKRWWPRIVSICRWWYIVRIYDHRGIVLCGSRGRCQRKHDRHREAGASKHFCGRM
jgi:hypothetical protein